MSFFEPRSVVVSQWSMVKKDGRFPVASSRKRSSKEASAASKVKPRDSISLTRSTTRPMSSRSPPRSTPSSIDLSSIDARPAISETSMRISFPTEEGSSCWYKDGSTLMAEACSPALCAKADTPVYGWRGDGEILVTSATACEIRKASRSAFLGRTSFFFFNSKLAMMVTRSALPVRSPYPLSVP